MFTKDTGILVKVVAVGTGQAIRIARNGDADALLVHHRPSEDIFIKDNFGKERFDVMYNDFVLIGPQKNKTKFETLSDFFIKAKTTSLFPFISRGDDSGTHKKEIELWNIFTNSKPKEKWYIEIGSGMGAALNMASATDSYTLSDRGTWLALKNKLELRLVLESDPRLINPYRLYWLTQSVMVMLMSTQRVSLQSG